MPYFSFLRFVLFTLLFTLLRLFVLLTLLLRLFRLFVLLKLFLLRLDRLFFLLKVSLLSLRFVLLTLLRVERLMEFERALLVF